MQVSHVQDHVTHAVIGGKETIDFSISNSAEFFNILSSTLYKDQILAVVREVLCNAWDAHIEAGCTDKPVEITLTHNKFTIKDFGKGIHHDDMGLIYGTYGNSTKKNDGKQTGGFGLGCKAPFAYTDHFEVTSCHAGIKTIYNLSKSSAKAMGKPGIIPIASFPSEDSGLTVSININNGDSARFDRLIRRIVSNGDMNMECNGKPINTIGFDTNKNNYLITTNTDFTEGYNKVFVRYGNVIYPVDGDENIHDNKAVIEEYLRALRIRGNKYQIVFQAPPHSISVTPSRESLSMQEHTIITLNKLFSDFILLMKTDFLVACSKYSETVVNKAVSENCIGELLKIENSLPDMHSTEDLSSITDMGTLAKVYLSSNYPSSLSYRKTDIAYRLNTLVKNNMLDRGKIQSFLSAWGEVKEKNKFGRMDFAEDTKWLQRRIIAPLLAKLTRNGLSCDKLFTCDSNDRHMVRAYNSKTTPLIQAVKASPIHLFNTLPYLRNIIVLTSKRIDLLSRLYNHDGFAHLGHYDGFLVYIIGRKAGEAEAARKFFADTKMTVIDLTLNIEEEYAAKRAKTVYEPAKKGVVCLSNLSSQYGIDLTNYKKDDAIRIDNPEYIIQISLARNVTTNRLDGWNTDSTRKVISLFGDKGGVVTTKTSYDRWIAKGAKPFNDYIIDKLFDYIHNNPRIQEYISQRGVNATNQMSYRSSFYHSLFEIPQLMAEFKLTEPLTKEDETYMQIYETISKQFIHPSNTKLDTLKKWLSGIQVSPDCQQLVTKMENNIFFDSINMNVLANMIKNNKSPTTVEKALKIFLLVFNS